MKTGMMVMIATIQLAACAIDAPAGSGATDSDLDAFAGHARELTAELDEVHGGIAEKSRRSTLVGLWHGRAHQDVGQVRAYLDMYWIIGQRTAWHVVNVYADEALTTPLLRWDLVRSYTVEAGETEQANVHYIRWNNLDASLKAYVEAPELFQSVGIDDCDLRAGSRTDITDGCGAPFFPFATCELLDFARIEGSRLTFGSPWSVDRCVARPTVDEAWSFERIPLSAEIVRALVQD
jgi:hypothetical protein